MIKSIRILTIINYHDQVEKDTESVPSKLVKRRLLLLSKLEGRYIKVPDLIIDVNPQTQAYVKQDWSTNR